MTAGVLHAAAASADKPAGWVVIVTACFVLLLVPYARSRSLSKPLIWAMSLIALVALVIGVLIVTGHRY